MEDERFSRLQLTALTVLRVLIGWHFLYEGIAKLQNAAWSANGFLTQSRGPFAGLFHRMAANADVMAVVNPLTKWGLACIGLGLMLGLFSRLASASGMLLLALFYWCNPPLIGYFYAIPTEGSYLVVNKNLVEMAALFVILVTNSSRFLGLDRFVYLWTRRRRG
jgi:thiosulfate dehydrogenase [quinone] large subunit